MNTEYLYLVAEQLYSNTLEHPLRNRNWLPAIYKSLLVANRGDEEEILWTKYNEWKIDHNCRAALSTSKTNKSKLSSFEIRMITTNSCVIIIQIKKGNTSILKEVLYRKDAFPAGLWEVRNPQNNTVLNNAFERDQLFESSISDVTIDLNLDGDQDADDSLDLTLSPNTPKPPISSSSIVYEKLELIDDQTHYIVFANYGKESFCNRKLSTYFTPEKITQILTKVNQEYECGNTFRSENQSPFVTLIPLFDKSKSNQTENQFLENILKDIIKSQNQYFKKPNICMVYSSLGFSNKNLFIKSWNKGIKSLEFEGFSNFLMD
jgi:hypothetical protein